MSSFVLDAKLRDKTGKEACKKYRKEGYIPSIIYGQGENINILINGHTFKKIYPKLTRSTILNLNLENKKIDVLIKDYDKNSLKDQFMHIDFYQIDQNKVIHVQIPLEFVGTAIGMREGGILEKHLVSLDIECLPKDIVNHFEVNIEHLKINESLHVKDIKLDKKYKVLSHPDDVIVRISGVKAETVEKSGEEQATTTTSTEEPKSEAKKEDQDK
ncbi:MAG TPA: 50S ribosomal protein L25 [Spirochaetota bacterium]|nr:50S ribosomal protein L25 [Spirochaetota bacterium]HOL56425.1 50S ribosomal protein L25 [Spirochaetota bacterium]HPP03416.1 50S ribosomal protein L25 [Spirochaetota bacterium]